MRAKRAAAALLSALAACGAAASPPETPAPETLSVEMKPCEASRPRRAKGLLDLIGTHREKLSFKGEISVEGKAVSLYLPPSKAYSVKNEGGSSADMENTSTLASIDADGDGRLSDDESWYASLPVRLGDRMYEITEIAADGSRIALRPSEAPLRGAVIGRRCPPFSYVAADGRKVSLEGFRGKALLLDVWSVT